MIIFLYSDKNCENQARACIQSLKHKITDDIKIVYYTVGFKSDFEFPNLYKVEYPIKPEYPRFHFYKAELSLETMRMFPDEHYIFTDTDVLFSHRFDPDKLKHSLPYPLASYGPHEYPFLWAMHYSETGEEVKVIYDETKLMKYFNVPQRSQRYVWSCLYTFNSQCKDFFEEYTSMCKNQYLNKHYSPNAPVPDYFPYADETAFNVCLWKRGATQNLGFAFVNTHDINTVKIVEESTHSHYHFGKNIDEWGADWEYVDNPNNVIAYHGFKDDSDMIPTLEYLLTQQTLSDGHTDGGETLHEENQKTIFIIDVYADTFQKEQILKKCIESIKPLGYDILITTHKQVKEDVAKMVNYVLFDRDNEFNEINFYANAHHSFPNSNLYVELYTTPDVGLKGHEFPIIKAMRNALSFSKELGYTQFIFSDFDSIFSDTDLNLITDMVGKMKDKKFSVFKNRDLGYEVLFFMGNTSYFIDKLNSFFPITLKEYNEKFTYTWPYGLEFFMQEMLIGDMELGIVNYTNFYEYFDANNKNIFRLRSYDAYIIPDQNGSNHICVQNSNQIKCDVEVFVDDVSVFKDELIYTIKDVHILKSENKNVKCVFIDNGVILKEINILYDKTNDYSKNGKLEIL
jgi:hypothetical protein